MQRFVSIILLSTYGLVSFSGHAGFDVLGLHSHGQVGSQCEHRSVKCCHCHHGHSTSGCSEEDSQPPTEHAEDCSVCKCFCLLKMHIGASTFTTAFSVPYYGKSFDAYEKLVTVDFKRLPKPRGPPAPQVWPYKVHEGFAFARMVPPALLNLLFVRLNYALPLQCWLDMAVHLVLILIWTFFVSF